MSQYYILGIHANGLSVMISWDTFCLLFEYSESFAVSDDTNKTRTSFKNKTRI